MFAARLHACASPLICDDRFNRQTFARIERSVILCAVASQ